MVQGCVLCAVCCALCVVLTKDERPARHALVILADKLPARWCFDLIALLALIDRSDLIPRLVRLLSDASSSGLRSLPSSQIYLLYKCIEMIALSQFHSLHLQRRVFRPT